MVGEPSGSPTEGLVDFLGGGKNFVDSDVFREKI